MNKWVVGGLTVVANTLSGISTYHFVKEGSTTGIVLSIVGLVVSNMLAVFAPALAGSKPAAVPTSVPKSE